MALDFKVLQSAYYAVEVDYDSDRHCDVAGCDSICRCRTIENVRVTSVNARTLTQSIAPKGAPLLLYAIERVLGHDREVMDTNNWEVSIEKGYYGEEIGGVCLDWTVATRIRKELEELEAMGPSEQVEQALKVEYGYLIPDVQNCNFEIVKVDPKNIHVGQMDHFVHSQREAYPFVVDLQSPIGLAVPTIDGYRLVDGFHRLAKIPAGTKRIPIVVARPRLEVNPPQQEL